VLSTRAPSSFLAHRKRNVAGSQGCDIHHCEVRSTSPMLIDEARRYTMDVERSRRRAFLMLAIMALWAVLPVSACLQASQPMGRRACCHGMAQACDSSAMNASGSCCLVHRQSAAVAPVSPEAVDHFQTLAAVSHPAIAVPAMTSVEHGNALAPPPSIYSSAGNSILRI
jgi:hypothetical protein